MAENNQTNKYAYLSRLSTKELEAILRADAELPSAGNDEAISYILEVIEQREHEHPSGSFPDIDSSWKEFQTIYNTPEGAEQSLYPNEQEMDLNGMSTRPKPTQKRKFRSAILVAAIIILLVASLTIPVAGFGNLLEMIGNWTADQFTFITTGQQRNSCSLDVNMGDSDSSSSPIGYELRQSLDAYEIKGNFVPTWLPEGFELYGDVSIQVYPEFGEVEFFASYLEGEEIFSISITKCSNSFQANTYEKTFQNPEIYVVDDIEHYIVDNSDTILAAWYVNNIECSINTTMSESDLKRVIDSIYEE